MLIEEAIIGDAANAYSPAPVLKSSEYGEYWLVSGLAVWVV